MQRKMNQVSSIFVIFLNLMGLSFCSCDHSQPAPSKTICSHLLPGLNKLRRGVDVTKLDLLPLKYNSASGFKYLVIDYNCAEGKTRYIGETVYSVPDEVSAIMNVPGGFLNLEVNILKKSSDALKMMSANIGISFIVKGLFSASASYKTMSASFYNESRYVEYILSHQSTSRADLIPKFALKLGEYAQIFVDKHLPSKFEIDREKYFEFIRTFGTHYFSHVKFGGSVQLYLETMKSYYQGKSETEVKAAASATFYKFLKGTLGVSWTSKNVDTHFISSSNKLIRYYGGDTHILTKGGMARWLPSVAKNPWVFGGRLVALSDLIQDESKRESMEKASQVYIDLAYLDSLGDILSWASVKYPISHKRIGNYMKQMQALKAAKASDHNVVVNLGDKIEAEFETPSWFSKQVQLCYKWRPDDTGVGQCGGGVGRHLCAKVGSMTQYYKDDTDKRHGGCRMQWGITKAGSMSEHWLRKIKICYKWWPDGNGGQCGGGADSHLCAPINQYTPEYRDDTDSRKGGCRMQWILMVPDDAPIWLRNMKLCFEWYADGDGGQCGDGVARLLCATTNSWTTPYRDGTDDRRGGCRMRWGIIPS